MSVPVALSDHAGPDGQTMRLQSAPIHPVLQLHCRADVEPSVEDSHEPWPLHKFGEHGCAVVVVVETPSTSSVTTTVWTVTRPVVMIVRCSLLHSNSAS